MRLKIYISGPITKGDRTHNFSQACVAHKTLMLNDFAPMNPMLSMMHPDAWTISHEHWLASDLPWVKCADAILRLPGESTGADEEVSFAVANQIPVFFTIEAIIAWRKTRLEKTNTPQEPNSIPVNFEQDLSSVISPGHWKLSAELEPTGP